MYSFPGVHNGLKVVNHEYKNFQCSVDENDEDVLNLPYDCFIRGFIPDNENVAVILSLEYVVSSPSNEELNIFESNQPIHRIIVGSSVFFPSQYITKISYTFQEDSKPKDRNGFYQIDMTKLSYSTDLGLTGDNLCDILVHSKFGMDTHLKSLAFVSFALSKADDNSLTSGKRKDRLEYVNDLPIMDQPDDKDSVFSTSSVNERKFRSESTELLKHDDISDYFDSRNTLRMHTELENSFNQTLAENMYKSGESRVMPGFETRKSRLLDASLQLNIGDDFRKHPIGNKGEESFLNPNPLNYSHFPPTNTLHIAQASQLTRVSNINDQLQYVGHLPELDIKEEINDNRLVSEISIQFLGLRFCESKCDVPTSIFCSFHFYNFRPVKTEVYKIIKTSSPLSILRRSEQSAPNDSPLAIRFVVDRSSSISSNYRFLDYLSDSFITVDIWDSDSLLPIGSCLVSCSNLI
jgi:hypothetical protein